MLTTDLTGCIMEQFFLELLIFKNTFSSCLPEPKVTITNHLVLLKLRILFVLFSPSQDTILLSLWVNVALVIYLPIRSIGETYCKNPIWSRGLSWVI